MIEIKKIYKKDIPELLSNSQFWHHSFLSISKHRLYAHYKNPQLEDNDIVLLLSFNSMSPLMVVIVFFVSHEICYN